MTISELIMELKKLPNWNSRVVIYGILNYPFQHASIKKVTIEDNGNIYLRIKND